jgi:hypothetical protein
MTLTPYWRRVLLAVPVIWCLLATGMYLWSVRGEFGFRGVATTNILIPIVTNGAQSGTLTVTCSVPTPLRPNHTYELTCLPTLVEMTRPFNPPIDVGLAVSASGFLISPIDQHIRLGSVGGGQDQFAPFHLTPNSSGNQGLLLAASVAETARAAQWSLDIEMKPVEIIIVGLMLGFPLASVYSSIFGSVTERNEIRALTQERIEKAENKAEQAPEKAKFAWELATVRLEAYFDRNLSQVSQVFWLAVVVTVTGFLFVLWAIVASLNQPQFTARAVIAGASGVITEFIGATFLVIYRSIMAQANEFIAVLERINTVGMAVQILDSIPEDQVELKNSTRSNLVALLAGMKSNLKIPSV